MISAALALTVVIAAVGADAKTSVCCSEGSPEGFNPSLFSSGTTKIVPALAERPAPRPIDGRLVACHHAEEIGQNQDAQV